MALADIWQTNEKAVLAGWQYGWKTQIASADIAQIGIDKIVLDLPQRGALGSVFTCFLSREDVRPRAARQLTRPAQDTKLTLTVTAAYGEATRRPANSA